MFLKDPQPGPSLYPFNRDIWSPFKVYGLWRVDGGSRKILPSQGLAYWFVVGNEGI